MDKNGPERVTKTPRCDLLRIREDPGVRFITGRFIMDKSESEKSTKTRKYDLLY